MDRIALGCGTIDAMLEGGVEAGCMTLLYGESGTGKTTICLMLAVEVARRGKRVIYVDTEGVSMERLRQIAGADFDEVVKNILFSNIGSFDEQEKMADKAVKLAQSNVDIGMLVMDSISMYYRLTSREDGRGERRSLAGQSTMLTNVAREKGLPVVVTSQVYTDVETGDFEALGGHALHHNAKTIVRLDRAGTGRRRAVLMKHRSLPEGLVADFQLTSSGISC